MGRSEERRNAVEPRQDRVPDMVGEPLAARARVDPDAAKPQVTGSGEIEMRAGADMDDIVGPERKNPGFLGWGFGILIFGCGGSQHPILAIDRADHP